MRVVTTETQERWLAPVKTGEGRAWARATIQPLILQKWPYKDEERTQYEIDGNENLYTSMVFGNSHDLRELTNIKSIQINRSIGSDVQTCTIELANTDNIPIGQPLTEIDLVSQERPGWFSFDRGSAGNPWGEGGNQWRGWIVPDRIIRTYEGYGIDPLVAADKDVNMYPSGVWLIDTVTLTPEGTMQVECRDLARELLEQMMFIPVIPKDYYPLVWTKRHAVGKPTTTWVPQGLLPLEYDSDSNLPYIGKGLVDGGKKYVNDNGGAYDSVHVGRHAFDGSKSTYWMSVGNKTVDSTSAFEWVQGLTPGAVHVAGVQIKAWGGPYSVYISVMRGGQWSGVKYIPYKDNYVDAGTRIFHVRSGTIKKGETKTFKIPVQYADGVEAIRVTLHKLYDSNLGTFPYRGGLYDVQWTPAVVGTTSSGAEEGNYGDYVDIVKTLLAWGGFYWPVPEGGRSFITSTDGTQTTIAQLSSDDPKVIAKGRVWGDIQESGVGGESWTVLDAEIWDKKPLIDGIKYIRDIISFIFFIDESGAAVFRTPNVWRLGNTMSGQTGGPVDGRTSQVLVLDDDGQLLQHSLKLTSLSRRDRIFVANITGDPNSTGDKPFGAVVHGYDPWPSGTRRISGWTDQHFATQEEVETMAYLIAVRQALKMRSVTVEIQGYPALQIDDQVIVREQVTGTNHLFYVEGISSTYDGLTGRYAYQLNLQWLGAPDKLMVEQRPPDGITLGTNATTFINTLIYQQDLIDNSHDVTLNTQGGTEVPGKTFVTGGSFPAPMQPKKTGHTFLGWFHTASGGSAITFPYSPGVTTDITLYAHWSP